MAQFIKLATSKALLLPFTVVGGATVGSAYVTYLITRRSTAAILGIDYENVSTTCQLTSTIVASLPVAGYLSYRHHRYSPPTFSQLIQQMNNSSSTTQTTSAGLPLNGPLQQITQNSSSSSSQLPSNVIRSAGAPPSNTRLSSIYSAIRVPIRFYAVNMLMSAAILGAGTSVGQRIICGKKIQKPN